MPKEQMLNPFQSERPGEGSSVERRRSSRFPIEREVRYKTLNHRAEQIIGVGRTLNISSSGVLFTTEHEFAPGTKVEVSISWPAQLNEKCMLNLVARGRIVRCGEGTAALQIQQYEFRTQSIAQNSTLGKDKINSFSASSPAL